VDCTVQQEICGKYDVKGYPTIKMFSKKGKSIQDYQQGRDARSIMDYANKALENNVFFQLLRKVKINFGLKMKLILMFYYFLPNLKLPLYLNQWLSNINRRWFLDKLKALKKI